MIRNKKQMYIVIGVFALILLLGTTTYAFFNYTRTGTQNIIKTGRISFNSTQGTAMNLDNLFPIDTTVSGIMNDATKVGTVTINVTGDTTYSDGIEYLVSAVNVQNTVGSGANAKILPISIDVSVTNNTNNDPATSLGTSDDDYFTHHGSSASTSIYKVLAGETIFNDDQLLVGYIKSGATGIDGNIVIKAYIDKEKVGISDTYPTRTVRTVKTTGYSSSDCETALTDVENSSIYCSTSSILQVAINGGYFTSAQIASLVNAGIVEEYTDGTPVSFGEDRTVFTTQEWNSIQQDGVSFQVKVEANEGTWVEEPIVPGTIPSCPGCKFMYTNNGCYFGEDNNVEPTQVSTLTGVTRDYRTLNKSYFLGFTEKDDGNSNMVIDRVFVCGIKGENPNQGTAFCIEGTTDGSKYSENFTLLNDVYGTYIAGETDYGCSDYGNSVYCDGNIQANANAYGFVDLRINSSHYCYVDYYGIFYCVG